MTSSLKTPFLALATSVALGLAAPAAVLAQTDQPAQAASTPQSLSGLIVSHHADALVVSVAGVDTTVMLTPDTKVEATVGVLGVRTEAHSQSDLIKGLAINIEATQFGASLTATRISFKPGDLKTAQAIRAGVAEGRAQVIAAQTENERRLSLIGQFDTKASTRVYFATGSAAINAEGAQALHDIASRSAAIPGSLLRVVGFTDSTGSKATNQRLSNQRASAVTAYLLRQCNVPPEHMASATGLADYVPVDQNDDPSRGSAQNRRVTVFVLVSKAAQGASSLPPH